jgi:hypothetical protein
LKIWAKFRDKGYKVKRPRQVANLEESEAQQRRNQSLFQRASNISKIPMDELDLIELKRSPREQRYEIPKRMRKHRPTESWNRPPKIPMPILKWTAQ